MDAERPCRLDAPSVERGVQNMSRPYQIVVHPFEPDTCGQIFFHVSLIDLFGYFEIWYSGIHESFRGS